MSKQNNSVCIEKKILSPPSMTLPGTFPELISQRPVGWSTFLMHYLPVFDSTFSYFSMLKVAYQQIFVLLQTWLSPFITDYKVLTYTSCDSGSLSHSNQTHLGTSCTAVCLSLFQQGQHASQQWLTCPSTYTPFEPSLSKDHTSAFPFRRFPLPERTINISVPKNFSLVGNEEYKII